MIDKISSRLPVFFNLVKKKKKQEYKDMEMLYLDKIHAYKTDVVACVLPVKPISKMLKTKE